jgi:hypothetical protein
VKIDGKGKTTLFWAAKLLKCPPFEKKKKRFWSMAWSATNGHIGVSDHRFASEVWVLDLAGR